MRRREFLSLPLALSAAAATSGEDWPVSALENIAWTPPTLVGTRLYVRDRKTMMALELGQA
jgi:hypothetical protein